MRSQVRSRGFNVAYRTEGTGPPVLLLAGLSQWADQWFDEGYHRALGGFRLIAIDRLGHGASDRPTAAGAYLEELVVGDTLAVLDAEAITRTAVWGFSLGAKNAMSLAVLRPAMLSALICGSNADMTAPESNRSRLLQLADLCRRPDGLRTFLQAAGVVDSDMIEDFLEHNPQPEALAACLQGSAELWVDPRDVTAPMLWYVGAAEGGFRPGETQLGPVLGTEMHVVPDANHLQAFQRCDEVSAFAAPFLKRTANT